MFEFLVIVYIIFAVIAFFSGAIMAALAYDDMRASKNRFSAEFFRASAMYQVQDGKHIMKWSALWPVLVIVHARKVCSLWKD